MTSQPSSQKLVALAIVLLTAKEAAKLLKVSLSWLALRLEATSVYININQVDRTLALLRPRRSGTLDYEQQAQFHFRSRD
jgi:hypothetical protein